MEKLNKILYNLIPYASTLGLELQEFADGIAVFEMNFRIVEINRIQAHKKLISFFADGFISFFLISFLKSTHSTHTSINFWSESIGSKSKKYSLITISLLLMICRKR